MLCNATHLGGPDRSVVVVGMNRKCRREHQKHWRVKELSDNRRLVTCTICGSVDQEFRVKGKNAIVT